MSKQIVFCAWGKRVNQYQIQFIWLVTTAASCLLCIHVGLLRSNSLWLPWLCVKAVPRRTTVQTAAARNTAHLFALEEHGRLSLKTRVELCVRVCVISPSENQCRRRTCQGHSTDKFYNMLSSDSDVSVIECHITMYDGKSHWEHILFTNIGTNLWHLVLWHRDMSVLGMRSHLT